MLTEQEAAVGELVEMKGQGRRGIFGGEPVVLTIIDNDLLPQGKVTCGWIDKDLHYQTQELKTATLEPAS